MNRRERNRELQKLYIRLDNGRYRYTGQWLTLEHPALIPRYLALFALQLLLTLTADIGILLTPAGPMIASRMDSFNYVILLFTAAFLCSAACIFYCWKVLSAKLRLPEHDSKYPDWHSIFSLLTALAFLGLLIAQLFYLFTAAHPDDRPWDLLLLAEAMLAASINFVSWQLQRSMKWTMLPNSYPAK